MRSGAQIKNVKVTCSCYRIGETSDLTAISHTKLTFFFNLGRETGRNNSVLGRSFSSKVSHKDISHFHALTFISTKLK